MSPYGRLHRLGILRNALEHFFERRRQGSQPFQALLEIIKLLPVWQCTLQQQVGDLFKGGVLRQVIDVVTAAGQADSFLAHGADGRRACGLSAQPADGSDWFSVAHKFKLFGFLYIVDPTCLRGSGNSERRTTARVSAFDRRHLFESPFNDGLDEFAARIPASAAITNLACASTIRVVRLVGTNPAKTTELFMGTGGCTVRARK
jgi:hypothetical protein